MMVGLSLSCSFPSLSNPRSGWRDSHDGFADVQKSFAKFAKAGADVSDLAYVDEARNWAEFLIRKEFKGPGDTIDAAMSRTARRHKIASAQLWGLRYRPPKDMAVSLYMRLRDAFRRESENLDRRLAHEIAIAESLGTDATNSKAYRVAVAALAEQAARK